MEGAAVLWLMCANGVDRKRVTRPNVWAYQSKHTGTDGRVYESKHFFLCLDFPLPPPPSPPTIFLRFLIKREHRPLNILHRFINIKIDRNWKSDIDVPYEWKASVGDFTICWTSNLTKIKAFGLKISVSGASSSICNWWHDCLIAWSLDDCWSDSWWSDGKMFKCQEHYFLAHH